MIIGITGEVIDDDEWSVVEDMAEQMGMGGAETYDYYAALLFNNLANSTYFTSEDAKSIANTAHTNVDATNSQSNSGTSSMTYSGVKTIRTAYRKLKGYKDTDTFISLNPDELIVPVDLEEDSWQVVNSVGKLATAENDRNFFNGRFTLYVWNRLTDTNAWGMMDSRMRRRMLRMYDRVGLEVMSDASFSQGVRKIGGYLRFVLGCTDWRWVYWSNPS